MASEAGEKGWYWGLEARRCDTCRASPALLFCRVDSAFLCGGCDARVHGANRLGSRHPRVWLCEVCEQAPAAVTCKADAAALCTACDADIHSANPLARRHERHPIVPFLDPASSAPKPSVAAAAADGGPAGSILDPSDEKEAQEAAASWLLPEPCPNPKPGLMEAPELKSSDYYFPEVGVDPYLDLEYASSMDTGFNHADGVVPVVHGKPVAGGAPPPQLLPPEGGCNELDFTGSKTCYSSYSVSSSEVGVVPDGGGGAMTDVTNPYGGGGGGGGNKPASAMDREARVMRYREKRKNRKFQKTIRYASRKAYAETRPRIKGRFAKRAEVEAEVVVGRMYSSAATAALMLDPGYSVVPSF